LQGSSASEEKNKKGNSYSEEFETEKNCMKLKQKEIRWQIPLHNQNHS
jgi:hypothetical protein